MQCAETRQGNLACRSTGHALGRVVAGNSIGRDIVERGSSISGASAGGLQEEGQITESTAGERKKKRLGWPTGPGSLCADLLRQHPCTEAQGGLPARAALITEPWVHPHSAQGGGQLGSQVRARSARRASQNLPSKESGRGPAARMRWASSAVTWPPPSSNCGAGQGRGSGFGWGTGRDESGGQPAWWAASERELTPACPALKMTLPRVVGIRKGAAGTSALWPSPPPHQPQHPTPQRHPPS